MRKPLRVNADNGIYLEAPIDETTDTPTPITAATVTARLFDAGRDGELLAPYDSPAQAGLRVSNARRFSIGETVRLELDDAVYLETTISGVDAVAGTIDIAAALTGPARRGNSVALKLGPDVALLAWNVSAADIHADGWGFVGATEHNHPGLYRGQTARVEIELDDGAGRRGFYWFEVPVEGPPDAES